MDNGSIHSAGSLRRRNRKTSEKKEELSPAKAVPNAGDIEKKKGQTLIETEKAETGKVRLQ